MTPTPAEGSTNSGRLRIESAAADGRSACALQYSAGMTDATLSTVDTALLNETIALAERARQLGGFPFAALVADQRGGILVRATNNAGANDGDPTQHAELLAVAQAARLLSPDQLSGCTLYSSAEPCAMCAGAIYWCNLGRVVYGLSADRQLQLAAGRADGPSLSLPCRSVFDSGQRRIAVKGPALQDEAADAHARFWQAGPRH
jgi:tRNA(Arg) A34 adenosine deaminase TadA